MVPHYENKIFMLVIKKCEIKRLETESLRNPLTNIWMHLFQYKARFEIKMFSIFFVVY